MRDMAIKYQSVIGLTLKKAALLLVLTSQIAAASVTISGTRIIFPGGERERTVRTTNKGTMPALVQVWIDDGQKNQDINAAKVPFTATPPVYRVEPGKGQSLRLIYNGMTLPQDRESVFWFNLLEIPPVDEKVKQGDHLELAFRTRIKLFYRPKSLITSSSADNADKLRWETVGNGIKVTNPTPYYFSFDSAEVNFAGNKLPLKVDMVPPFGNMEFTLANKGSIPGGIKDIRLGLINDYGTVNNIYLISSGGKGLAIKK